MSKKKHKKHIYHVGWSIVNSGKVTDVGYYMKQTDKKLKNENDFEQFFLGLAKQIGVLSGSIIINSMSYLGKVKVKKQISGKENEA